MPFKDSFVEIIEQEVTRLRGLLDEKPSNELVEQVDKLVDLWREIAKQTAAYKRNLQDAKQLVTDTLLGDGSDIPETNVDKPLPTGQGAGDVQGLSIWAEAVLKVKSAYAELLEGIVMTRDSAGKLNFDIGQSIVALANHGYNPSIVYRDIKPVNINSQTKTKSSC